MTTKIPISARPAAKSERAIGRDATEGQATFDMANLRPERTGLPFVVFVSQKGGARHDVRVKVAQSARVRQSEMISVAVHPAVRAIRGTLDPADLAPLTAWIEQNRTVLIDYWNGDIEYTEDVIDALKPVESSP